MATNPQLKQARKLAKYTRALRRAQNPPPRKPRKTPRKPQGPTMNKARVLTAIQNSYGVKSVIAARLGCTVKSLWNRLRVQGSDWDDVRDALKEEAERVVDVAESRLHELLGQDLDKPVALRAASIILKAKGKDRGYGDQSTVRVEGGVAVQVQHVDVDKLPLDLRRQLLAVMQATDAQPKEPEPVDDEPEEQEDEE